MGTYLQSKFICKFRCAAPFLPVDSAGENSFGGSLVLPMFPAVFYRALAGVI